MRSFFLVCYPVNGKTIHDYNQAAHNDHSVHVQDKRGISEFTKKLWKKNCNYILIRSFWRIMFIPGEIMFMFKAVNDLHYTVNGSYQPLKVIGTIRVDNGE